MTLFHVYEDIRAKLIQSRVPEEEIAFIHDADAEAKKKDLFAKVRTGQVRVLLGSTQKMGADTNVQDRLVAVHHLDVGWRPADMTQRNGRIIRQGNRNKEVQVYQYVTEGTFDAYLYQAPVFRIPNSFCFSRILASSSGFTRTLIQCSRTLIVPPPHPDVSSAECAQHGHAARPEQTVFPLFPHD